MKRLFTYIVLALLAASCSVEKPYDTPTPTEDARATLTINLRAPTMSRGGETRAFPSDYEDAIHDVALFLAHDDGGGFLLDSMVVVDEFRQVSATTQAFSLRLPQSAVPTKIYVVANLMDADNNLAADYAAGLTAENGKGMDESTFIRRLVDNWSAVSAAGSCMYMSGSAVLPKIGKQDTNLHIPLLRWVARADVNIDLDADSKPFVPASVTAFHGYRDACIIPAGAAYDTENAARVLTPTLAGADRLDSAVGLPVDTDGTSGIVATTYLGEHAAALTPEDELDAPCLILGGYFAGSTTPSYYRIDFNSGLDGHPFGQILRNWNYVFNVTKIMSAGYDTPEEAAANPAHSIVIEVQMWDENVQQINFIGTGDYMYVNTLDVMLNYNQSAQNTFVVRSTLPFEWGFDTATTLGDDSDEAQTDPNFSVSIVARDTTATDYTDYTFQVITLTDNITNGRNKAGIFITANNAVISVELEQRAELITDRVINVLSLTEDIGTMWTWYKNGTQTGSNNMRSILTNPAWFGPTGKVKCGGFTFDVLQSGDILSTSTVSMDRLTRMLASTDILLTNYSSDPPQEVVDKILEWNQKPYHVLFVVADGGGTTTVTGDKTNVILRETLNSSPFFDAGLTWHRTLDFTGGVGAANANANAVLTAALGSEFLTDFYLSDPERSLQAGEPMNASPAAFVMADQTDENATFMAGPFGLPDQGMRSTNASYRLWDDISEWAMPSEDSPVTPLLVLEANVFGYSSYNAPATKTRAMMIGVDIAHTTVYMGEAQHENDFLVTAPPTGFTPGLAGSPYYNSLSLLMSNIWGWAVQNVLAQVQEEED